MSVITQDIRNNIPSNKRNRSNSATGQNIRGSNSSANDNWKLRKSVAENVGSNSPYPPSADTSFSTQSTLRHPTRKETRTSKNRTVKKTGLHANTPPKDNKKIVVKNKPVKIKKSKYAHNLKQVGMPQDGGFSNQDYVIKGISTNLSQGNPNNKDGEYKDENTGLNDRNDPADKSTVDYSPENKDPIHKPLKINIDIPMKQVTAPHRNPTNKKVWVQHNPSKKRRPKNTSGSARFSGGGLVASLYESF